MSGGYERSDLNAGVLAAAILALLVLMFVGIGIGFGVLGAFESAGEDELEETHPMAEFREKAKAPLLQANPTVELREHRAWEQETLTTYAWIDRKDGIVRIPIHVAMKLVLEEGLPARGEKR